MASIQLRRGLTALKKRYPRKKLRTYRVRIGWRSRWQTLLLLVSAVVMIVCAWQLIRYGVDYVRSVRLSAELRAIYEEELPTDDLSTPLPHATETPYVLTASQETQDMQPAGTPDMTLDPLATPEPKTYPLNPYRIISDRFVKLRRQNTDIIGWLTVGDLLSEAVVQRDNTYYLRRDYRGYHNENGAIFLDEDCGLSTRPHTLILYGHNMKTGAMFGSLRHYENLSFYRSNPFLSFDTLYEEGRYVIFSVAEVSLDMRSGIFSAFYRLPSCTNMERAAILNDLCRLSKHTCAVDVNAEDQILLLVTCVGDDTDRRIVAARRVRDDETEGYLYSLVQSARSK